MAFFYKILHPLRGFRMTKGYCHSERSEESGVHTMIPKINKVRNDVLLLDSSSNDK
jgi:hypothetical protein